MRPSVVLRVSFTVLALGAAFACAENALPTSPNVASTPTVLFGKAKDGKTVAECPLQKEAWKTVQIGATGGTVSVPGSTLVVPAGALTSTVAITAHALPLTSASVEFFPEGLQFAVPAQLTINYGKCKTPLLGVAVAYVQADTISEIEPSLDYQLLKYVTGEISHFSSYAVAY